MAVIDYRTPDPPNRFSGAMAFISLFAGCALVSLIVVGPLADHILFDHLGDQGFFTLKLFGMALTTIFSLTAYIVNFQSLPRVAQYRVAAFLGMFSIAPGYVIAFLLF